MSGKVAKRKRRSGYGRHAPLRVISEDELREGLADLENLPPGASFVVLDAHWCTDPACLSGAQRRGGHGGYGVE